MPGQTPAAPLTIPKAEKTTRKLIVDQLLNVGLIGVFVSPAFFVLDIFTQKKQTEHAALLHPISPPLSSTQPNLLSNLMKMLGRCYWNTFKAGFAKNAVLAQREVAAKLVKEGKLEFVDPNEGGNSPASLEGKARITLSLTTAEMLAAAGILSSVETVLTQEMSYMRALMTHQLLMDKNRQPYTLPQPKAQWADRQTMFFNGLNVRFAKNSVNALGLMYTPKLEQRIMQECKLTDNTQCSVKLASSLITGASSGVLAGGLDYIYKNQIIRTDPKTFTAPSFIQTFQTLRAAEGLKFLTTGAKFSMISTILAYNILPLAEEQVRPLIPLLERKAVETGRKLRELKAEDFKEALYAKNTPWCSIFASQANSKTGASEKKASPRPASKSA